MVATGTPAPSLSFSLHGEFGSQTLDYQFSIEPKDLVEKFLVPSTLLSYGVRGVGSVLGASGFKVKPNARLRGYSGTEYVVPFVGTDDTRVVIADLLWSDLFASVGLPKALVNSRFLPISLAETFRYLDIANGQKKPHLAFMSVPFGFNELGGVPFMDLIRSQVGGPSLGDLIKGQPQPTEEQYDLDRIQKAYFIPTLRASQKDLIYAGTLDPKAPSDARYLRGFGSEIGLQGFLNPTLSDYGLVAASKGGSVPDRLESMLARGISLGHAPSRSKGLGISLSQAENDPNTLLEALAQRKLVRTVRGKWGLTAAGKRTFELEITGRPKESAFNKILRLTRIIPPWFRGLL